MATFRHRAIGLRAASPPTWACYEQIHDDRYDDDDEDCSDEEEDGHDDGDEFSESGGSDEEDEEREERRGGADVDDEVAHDMEMDVDAEGTSIGIGAGADEPPTQTLAQTQTAAQVAKGKQRAVDPAPPPKQKRPTRQKQPRQRVFTLRPILTIQRSQGFVWNQDLFVPPYIKDRYVASTSPPNSIGGFISTSVSSTNSALTDYEVEVVEIRVQEGEFDGIIP